MINLSASTFLSCLTSHSLQPSELLAHFTPALLYLRLLFFLIGISFLICLPPSPPVGLLRFHLTWEAISDHLVEKLHQSLSSLFNFVLCSVNSPGGSDGKASAYHVGDPGSIPGSGRSPWEGNGNPLQYSCPENPMDRGT